MNVIDLAATILMITFLIAESIADDHLFKFHQIKKYGQKGGKLYEKSLGKGFMTEGLWRYMRHPNYASEQGVWISFYFFGVAASGQWINFTLAEPVLLVLLFIGSSQLTESISSGKYPAYTDYKKSVPKFLPKLFFKWLDF